ncbi:alpha/beta hydrolase family protein [Inhella gelatinilytica]|uniref:S9 family peptidase n=1 Tax=Inhella gelatinilytica TaxID=2795030 RepID=A0A931NCN3_9BURK|nr:prolyl oligopeptidase family serine peptidase [Inhella gelatinilytica]MBH9551719.1 S9 family peptidase [Inhella gelatinilytica]
MLIRFARPLGLLAAGLTLVASGVWAQSAKTPPAPASIPLSDFFRTPQVFGVSMSPDGRKIAAVVTSSTGRRGLAVADVDQPRKFKGIAQYDNADIINVQWVNNDRLAFGLADFRAAAADQDDQGLFAINADGSELTWVIDRGFAPRSFGGSAKPPLASNFIFRGPIRDGSVDVLALRIVKGSGDDRIPPSTELVRINTETLGFKSLPAGDIPRASYSFLVDRKGAVRLATSGDARSRATYHWRDEDGNWKALGTFDQMDPEPNAFTPLQFDFDGSLLVTALDGSPARTAALYRYDPATGKRADQPLVSIKGFDFEGRVIIDQVKRKTLGVSFLSDAQGQVWFEPTMKANQAAIDKLLPSTNNLIQCSYNCLSTRHLVVTSYSDRQPAVYSLFDRETGSLVPVAETRPWLDPRSLATQEFLRVKARDGRELPLYYTKPQGKGPFPTVALVHGGPFVRGHEWGFDSEAQFLASRGYLVLEVEFRGSKGYGDEHLRAGWRQWGQAMQDDVTDVTRWAIAQGLADAKRVAIAGASYGGYATMMGLVREPELYKAGINWVGVTDIELMYSVGWSDFMGGAWMRYGMPKLIGDAEKDRDMLRRNSPLLRASEIKQPVLLAYGEKDFRVPLPHGTKMRDALIQSGNKQVEWVEYEGEGHGFMLPKNRDDFYTRVERFLARHLQ